MKLVSVLLLALCGLAAGIQYPLSYEYEYYGEIKTGMPELRQYFAGAGLKAKLSVTVVSEGEAHVQISNARAGTVNAEVKSSGRAPLPVTNFAPLKDAADLQKSFTVHFSGRQEKLEVPAGEMLWHSNLRKAIVSLLRVPYVLSSPGNSGANTQQNRIDSEHELPKSFKKEEQTVMGKCNVLYTVTQSAPRDSMQLQELTEDAQRQQRSGRRSGASVRGRSSGHRVQGEASSSSDSSYRMVRSVDFYDCKDRVVMMRSSHGNLTDAGIGQLRGAQSRSSVGEYLLSGEPTSEMSMRIEKAIIEGVVTLNPFGHETKKIMTITNQTLTLLRVSEQPLVPKPTGNLKEEPWAFRVESPHSRAPNSPDWITYKRESDATYPIYAEKDTTGFQLTQDLRSKLKVQILSLINQVAQQMKQQNKLVASGFGGSVDGVSVQKIAAVVSKVRALPKDDLEQLYHQLAPVSSRQESVSSQSRSSRSGRDQRRQASRQAPMEAQYENEPIPQAEPPAHQANAEQSSQQQSSNIALLKRELFISALKASGSGAAIKVLVEKMKSNDISALEAANIFTTFKANVESPAILPELVEYVMSISDEASVSLKSSSLINLSSLIRRICLNRGLIHYSYPAAIMGAQQCQAKQIVPKYVQYLEGKLRSASKVYLKAIYVQALANIGDKSAVKIIGKLAEETATAQSPISIRLQAIQGLSKNRMLNTSYSIAQDILLGIAEAQVEPEIVREAALASLFTLPKNATFWQRLALSTWREPSKRVASFQYSLIKAMAGSKNLRFINQISMAKHVLPQAKPQPRSASLSALMMSAAYNVEEDMGLTMEAFYLASDSSLIPEQMNVKLLSILGGMKLPLFHLSTIGKGLEQKVRSVMDKFKGLEERQPQHNSNNLLAAAREWEQAAGGHKYLEQASEDDSLFVHLHILKHIEIFSPITKDSLEQLQQPSKSVIGSIVDKLRKNEQFEGVSYYNPTEIAIIMPSEIGLPIIGKMSRPTLAYSQLKAKLTKLGGNSLVPSFFNISGDAVTKLVQKRNCAMKVLVPWVNKTLIAAVDNEATFSLPAKFFVSIDATNPSVKQFQFGVQPTLQSQSPIVIARNLPYTLVRELFPVKDVTEQPIKPIHVVDDDAMYTSTKLLSKDYSGLDAKLKFSGDTQTPFNMSSIMQHLWNPTKMIGVVNSLTARYYQVAFLLDLQQSQTKQISGTVSIATPAGSHAAQQSSTGKASVVPALSAEDTMSQRLSKLSQAGVSVMVSASLNLTGSQPARKYEAAFLKFVSASSGSRDEQGTPRKQGGIQVNLMRSKIPSVAPTAMQTCVTVDMKYPSLSYKAQLSQVLQSNMDSVMESQVYVGEQCKQENEYFTVKAFQRVSEERKQHLAEIQSKHLDASAIPALDSTQAVKSALVYDRLDAEIRETKPMSDTIKNITNHVSDLLHGYLFPLVSHNGVNVKNTKGLTVLNATRSFATDRYTIWTKKEKSICVTQNLKVAPIVDYLSPLNSFLHLTPQEAQQGSARQHMQVMSGSSMEQCVVKPDSVQTFAKVQYGKSPFACSTLAVKTDSNEEERFVILTKPKSESGSADQEIKIIYPKEALTVIIQKDGILVNGQKIAEEQKEVKAGSAKKTVAKVSQSAQSKKVEFDDHFSCELKEGKEVVIKLDSRFRSKVSGLCGRYSQKSMGDLRDSRKCLYDQQQGAKFAASWVATSEAQQCKQSSPSARQLMEQVAEFQQHCPKSLHAQASQRKTHRQ